MSLLREHIKVLFGMLANVVLLSQTNVIAQAFNLLLDNSVNMASFWSVQSSEVIIGY